MSALTSHPMTEIDLIDMMSRITPRISDTTSRGQVLHITFNFLTARHTVAYLTPKWCPTSFKNWGQRRMALT